VSFNYGVLPGVKDDLFNGVCVLLRVFRLVTANTAESKILNRAGAKRKLEALVIGHGPLPSFSHPYISPSDHFFLVGKFEIPGSNAAQFLGKTKGSKTSMSELAEVLLRQDSEKISLAGKDDEIISDKQLEAILDRSVSTFFDFL
jgi:ATP-dependent DNA helicase